MAISIWVLQQTQALLPTGPHDHREAMPTPARAPSTRPALVLFLLVIADVLLTAACAIAYLYFAEWTTYRGPTSSSTPIDVTEKIWNTWMYYTRNIQLGAKYYWTTSLLCFLTSVPTLAHLLLGSAYLILKLVSGFAKSVLAVLLLRVSQGKDGVLRQLAVAIGALAKLIEVTAKV
jgi:hypothetical protein